MINITSYGNSVDSSLLSDINKDDSLLIIGKAANEYKLNDFTKPNSYSEMKSKYGDSDLTTAYLDAYNCGAKNIFVMNCYQTTDFIDCMDFIRYYNFSCVIPIGIRMSDVFYDSISNKEVYYAEHYLNNFSSFTNSLIIFTDNHASEYENIDHFINNMNYIISEFKSRCNYTLELNGRNLAFCANNLENIKFANVVLGAYITSADIGTYPETSNITAIFDMYKEDFLSNPEIVYFRNSLHTETSIENLNNFRITKDAVKILCIDRVIKHIERTLDTSFVVGKLYGQYIEMILHDYLDTFFRALLNTKINNYTIKQIKFVKETSTNGYMETVIEIMPINSFESVELVL